MKTYYILLKNIKYLTFKHKYIYKTLNIIHVCTAIHTKITIYIETSIEFKDRNNLSSSYNIHFTHNQ